jgi:hypothetical protein
MTQRPARNRPRSPQFHLPLDAADAATAVVWLFRAQKRDGGHLWGMLTAAHPEVPDRVGYIRMFWGKEGQPHVRVSPIVWDEPGNSPERTLAHLTRPTMRPTRGYERAAVPAHLDPATELGRYNIDLLLAAVPSASFPEEVELDLGAPANHPSQG